MPTLVYSGQFTPEAALYFLEMIKSNFDTLWIENGRFTDLLKKQQIENLYLQTKREIELFQKAMPSKLPQPAPPAATPPQPPEQETAPPESTGLTIEQVEKEIEKTIALLLQNSLIRKEQKKVKDKVFNQYWLKENTPAILKFLEAETKKGTIRIGDYKTFMIQHLKSQKGHTLRDTFKTAKNVKKRKNP